VQALALPLLIRIARHSPDRMRGSVNKSGAALTLLRVKTPAHCAGRSEQINAMSSRPDFLMPEAPAANLNPFTVLMVLSVIREHSTAS
jgi:hypothetical protein